MFKRFWYPAITNDEQARTATMWSIFGYVWIGGGQMFLALLNAAGWFKSGSEVEVGILMGVYAAIFGWLTWKQSYSGTIIGFVLYVGMLVAGLIMSIFDGTIGKAMNGWWATVAQIMLLLNGVRASQYTHRSKKLTLKATTPATAIAVAAATAGSSTVSELLSIRQCPGCATKVLPTSSHKCPNCVYDFSQPLQS